VNPRKLLQRADRIQQRRPWLAFGIAAWKKFGDDQAGNLAALVAYYAFFSIFPLLLVLVTVLDLVLRGDPQLRQKLLHSAYKQYPLIGQSHYHSLTGTGIALVIGIIGTLLGARGVANAIQNALNTVWEVPFTKRPGFPWSMLRSIGLIVVIGLGQIIAITLSGVAGGTGHLITGGGARVAAVAVSLVLNLGVFWLAFRIGTARQVAGRDMLLGAVIAAVIWQILLAFGGYLIAHELKSSSAYGTFAVVLGLLAWFYVQAQLTLYAVEINVVRAGRLWPRSMFPPPLTAQDRRAYELYALAEQRRPELAVVLRPADEEPARPGAGGNGRPGGEPSGHRLAEPTAGTRPGERTEQAPRRGFRRPGGRQGR
jgi:membrane protein